MADTVRVLAEVARRADVSAGIAAASEVLEEVRGQPVAALLERLVARGPCR